MLTRSLHLLLFIGLLTSLIACDSTGPDDSLDLDVEEGRYALDISGDLPGASSGEATFGELPAEHEDGPAFAVVLTGETSEGESFQFILYRESVRPGPGSYSFVEYDYEEDELQDVLSSEEFLFFGFEFSFGTGEEATGYHVGSQAGTLTILESTSQRVAGTFTVEAKGAVLTEDGEQPVSGTYEGEFVANYDDIDSLN